jgi:CheY-like chemotaxis protein
VPAALRGDAHRVRQVLTNLLGNALKFTEHGEVALQLSRVAGDAQQVTLRCTVRDTGIGIAPEALPRLFKPFSQADTSTTRRFGGTGLGLTISRHLARLMGGDIEVSSTLGGGSTFSVRLPLQECAPAETGEHVAAGSGARLAGLRLLAADDVELNRYVLEELLAPEGGEIVFVENGQEAVDMVRTRGAEAFDVVLMDIQMPVMDGYQATARIHEIAPALPVIGLTAHALAEERQRSLDAGMVAHITKPIDPDLLVGAILDHARRRADAAAPAETLADAASAEPADAGGIDWPALAARYNNRQAFIERLIAMLLDSQRDTPAKLRAAARAGGAETLASLAHGIKGVAGNMEAHGLHALALRLERATRGRQEAPDAAALELAEELAVGLETLFDMLARRRAAKDSQ